MQDAWTTAVDRLRQPGVQLACGGALALAALTAAHAAVRTPILDAPEAPPVVQVAAEAPAPAVDPEPSPPLLTFAEPVPGHPVNSPFGLRRLPWETHGRLHEGVDIAAPAGAAVVAAADGVVARAGRNSSYGTFVELRHAGGLRSFYAHMGRLDEAVKAGAFVRGGARIGKIGNSGTSTGPHLHFEIRKSDDRPLNPVAFIGKSFDSLDELPLKKAAYVSRKVRVAVVSEIPASKKALMEARKAGRSSELTKANLVDEPMKTPEGRVRARLSFDPAAAPAVNSGVPPLIEVVEG